MMSMSLLYGKYFVVLILEVVGEVDHFRLEADQLVDLQVTEDLILSLVSSLDVVLLLKSVKFEVEHLKVVNDVLNLHLALWLLRRD